MNISFKCAAGILIGLICGFVLLTGILHYLPCDKLHKREPQQIVIKDMTGPLGSNVGEVMTVVLKKEKKIPTKGFSEKVVIISVNGIPIEKSSMKYTFLDGSKKQLDDDKYYTCLAYQSGGFSGVPANIPQDIKENVLFQSHEFHFDFYLVLCDAKISK